MIHSPFIRLSYDIDENAPRFPTVDPMERAQRASMEKGDPNNTSSIKIHTHYGTHVDAPYHFDKEGLKITDFDVNDFHFKHPVTIDIGGGENQPITPKDIKAFEDVIGDKDLLLIRTGFSRYRKDHQKYLNTPYIDIEAARYIIDQFPKLRGLGIDFVSILNRQWRAIGIEAHRILLGCYKKGRFLFIIEDMNLDFGERELEEVIALPLFVKDADAFPCTVIGR
jgi:arylformamidase